MAAKGRLFGLGVGPGDPELITLKALRLLKSAPVVAYHAARGKKGNAFTIVEDYLSPEQVLLPLIYPVTTEKLPDHMDYEQVVKDFYGEITTTIASHLDQGQDVAVIAEGDPFFYGSFMYIHDRLRKNTKPMWCRASVPFWGLRRCLVRRLSIATRPCPSFPAS
ncbi:precorrin-2 C(20)-methyltransferase [Brucella melitensis B115]|nr:precorrin-2 C(20)-methyltransferase [Brucella melitensis B115]